MKKLLSRILYRINPSRRNEEILLQNNRYLREINFSAIFNNSITDVDWILSKSFSPSGAAANYSFLYILFKILDLTKPLNIVELGMGESSKLLFQYANYNLNSKLYCVDDNKFWMDLTKTKLSKFDNGNIEYSLFPLKEVEYNGVNKIKAYDGLDKLFLDKSVDLLIIDGPHGNKRYSRIGAMELLDNLNNEFIIIVDDCDRQGELDLAKEIIQYLNNKNIDFDYAVYFGIKSQYIIYSKNFSYLKTI